MKMKTNFIYFLVLLLSFGMVSCIGDFDDVDSFDIYAQFQEDSLIITDYITENNIPAYDIANSGVYIHIFHEGDVNPYLSPTFDSDTSTTVQYVTSAYKGYFLDGEVFDETADSTTIEFALANVIGGWQIAFTELSEGDSATIFIPSYWGYGYYGSGSIPGNTVIAFDVYLESFERR